MTRIPFFVSAVICSLAVLAGAEPDAATKRWWSHVQVLAADDMEGRDTGSEGYRRAAKYVVEQFTKAGVKPAGASEFDQPVPLQSVEVVKDQTSVSLVNGSS